MMERSEVGSWRIVQIAAIIFVLGAFLFQTRDILNPVVLFLLLWAVVSPYRGRPGHGALLGIAGALTLFWLLVATGTLLAPFVLSFVLAYMLDPLADRIEARGASRTVAVLAIVLPVFAIVPLALLFLVPSALGHLGEMVEQTPVLIERFAAWTLAWEERVAGVDVAFLDLGVLIEQLQRVDSAAVVEFLRERREALASGVWTGVLGLGRGLGSVLTVVGYVALTPVLAYYLIRDFDRVKAVLTELVPQDVRPGVESFVHECDELVSGYLRGQVTVAISIGLITGVGLALVSFPYAVTLGFIVAIFSVVPYLGLVISLVPAIVIALMSGSVGLSLLKVAGVYGIAQILDGTLITPRIVGDSVGIHPVVVVLALSLGGFFFGFVGLLVGVPMAAVAKLLIRRGLDRYRASDFYRGVTPGAAG